MPSASGGCILFGATITGTENDAQAAIDLDASYGVSGTTGAGDTTDNGPLRSVDLAFRRRL